ncbi:pectate lyase family protein [Mucilaginibacter sp. SJ]|uniref:pectate lyase family protein n=1 Tax=Mucilaginibacter sp. SJ TaxID=3029053 RepID=UPI0023AA13DD|nr:pectate lyase [Mucilaginibacter sp. SJ]WEA01240.1 pectate lyase [Mucilaginibacter sp. SJ]
MQKTKSLKKMTFGSLALSAIILIGSCSKNADQPVTVPINDLNVSKSLATTAPTIYTMATSSIRLDQGYAYKFSPVQVSGDSNTQPTASTLQLYENGVALGPAHSVHSDIRNLGKGRYSHWDTGLYFSTSDNSSPLTNGRKYTYTLTGTATSGATAPATSTPVTSPVTGSVLSTVLTGYAAVNGITTGGKGGTTVTVSTLAAFKSAVAGNSPKIVYVSGTISGSGLTPVYVGSNTTIIGKTGAVLSSLNLYLFTVSNIIIQNVTFRNYVTECGIYVKFQSNHVWIDHCDFATDRSHGWDYWGKDIGVAEGSDYVTISWNKFHDTYLSLLIGSVTSDAVTANTGKLHVTVHHNYWYNVAEREPTLVFGSIHMYNNYHLNNDGYSIGARYGGTVRTDNEYFSGCKKPLTTNLDGDPVGYFSGVSTNIYSNCGANNITSSLSSWVPSYAYSSLLDAAANVPAVVTAGAGVKTVN